MRGTGLLATIIVTAATAAGAGCQTTTKDESAAVAAAVVEQAYQRLSRYSGGSAQGLGFELSDLRTATGKELNEIRFVDLATLGHGDVIDIQVQRRRGGRAGYALYQPSWRTATRTLTDDERARYLNKSVGEVIRTEGAGTPIGQVTAVTTFTVEARLQGKSRRYRAAFLWRTLPTRVGREATAAGMAVDQVTVGLNDVLAEASAPGRPPIGDGATKADGVAPLRRGQTLPNLPPTCYTSTHTEQVRLSRTIKSVKDPTKTVLTAKLDADLTCSCATDCTSRCVVDTGPLACDPDGCRRVTQAPYDERGDFEGEGQTKGAECAVALGCGVRGCTKILFCFCGEWSASLSPTFMPGPKYKFEAKFELKGAPAPEYAIKLAYNMKCSRCYVQSEFLGPPVDASDEENWGGPWSDWQFAPLPGCGDGTCNDSTETCETCPTDCGDCGSSSSGAGGSSGGGGGGSGGGGTLCGDMGLGWYYNHQASECASACEGACQTKHDCGGRPCWDPYAGVGYCQQCPQLARCGDGACQGRIGENCETCPSDCGQCPTEDPQTNSCGSQGFYEAGDYDTCVQDCGECTRKQDCGGLPCDGGYCWRCG